MSECKCGKRRRREKYIEKKTEKIFIDFLAGYNVFLAIHGGTLQKHVFMYHIFMYHSPLLTHHRAGRCDKSGVCFPLWLGPNSPTWTNSNKARVVGHPNKISWIISSDIIHETLSTVEDKQKGKIFMPRWDDVCANSWWQKADLEPVSFFIVFCLPRIARPALGSNCFESFFVLFS